MCDLNKMLSMRKILLTFGLLCATAFAFAQQTTANQRLVSPGKDFFVPHWYVSLKAGAAYDVGEAKFSKLVSPSAQVALGYHFTPLFAARLAVSGWEARNAYAYPTGDYKWKFIQPSIDGILDLTNLIGGWKPDRFFHAYALAGVGVALSFDNGDAESAHERYDGFLGTRPAFLGREPMPIFQKIWYDSRWNPVVRAGLGVDFHISESLAIGAEVNANMLPDHFNSKIGKHDNKDWHFNALVGAKFTIGKTHGHTDPIYEEINPQPQPQHPDFVDVPVDKISFNVNVYFVINQSIIRSNQMDKLNRLLRYLQEHPKAFVRLSGFADKDTGNPQINMRLSIERSQVVSQWLMDNGIQEWRIRRFAKGDRVQPYDVPEENRVCICFVYDPENPVPQKFEY